MNPMIIGRRGNPQYLFEITGKYTFVCPTNVVCILCYYVAIFDKYNK
jgi:hypothetical protein